MPKFEKDFLKILDVFNKKNKKKTPQKAMIFQNASQWSILIAFKGLKSRISGRYT